MAEDEVNYPIFLACAGWTADPYWKRIFEGLSVNQPPRGVIVSDANKTLYCTYKNKEFNYQFDEFEEGEEKSDETIYNELTELFTDKLKLSSSQDQVDRRNKIQYLKQCLQDKSENDVQKQRRKVLRDQHILEFLQRQSKKFRLTQIQQERLSLLVNLSLTFKLITDNDFVYEDDSDKLSNINGLEFEFVDKNIGDFKIIKECADSRKNKVNNKHKILAEKWHKYLNQLR